MCDAERAEPIVEACGAEFRAVIADIVGEPAVSAGHFTAPGRDGVVRAFPIATVSTAVLVVRPERWVSVNHLGVLAADVKRRAKQRGPGTVLVEHV